ncbi:MAG: single-stranded DNA-binding protein [Lachnospiraceae bacterium]|nr:single-stranded DNA-binding protein [Lachnospiraceae bacterium]
MNKIILMGRLTRDPEVRYTTKDNTAVARYSLAVDKKFKRDDGVTADFFNIVAFGKSAEFAEKYLRRGMKMLIAGRVQTGTYEKDSVKIPFFEVVVEEQEFAESKVVPSSEGSIKGSNGITTDEQGFMHIPDDFPEELPFN